MDFVDKHTFSNRAQRLDKHKHTPVRMVWKAVSTLVESRADVSRKDSPFFSAWQRQNQATLSVYQICNLPQRVR